jgi:hypothetical protein
MAPPKQPGMLIALCSAQVLMAWACGKHTQSVPTQTDGGVGSVSEPTYNAGDRVVVESARGQFFEAVVRRAGKTRLQVEAPDGGASHEIDVANVYSVEVRPSVASIGEGSFAICEMAASKWSGCRVQRRDGPRFSVSDEDGRNAELEASHLLKPSAITELNLRQSFEQATKRKAFLDGLREAGHPWIPPGWTPRPGDHVLVQSADAYVAGRVQKIKKGQVFVVIDGGDKQSRGFSREEVFVQPPVQFTPTASTYACVRPESGSQQWPVVRIEGIADGKVAITDVQGHRRSVETRELVPFGK